MNNKFMPTPAGQFLRCLDITASQFFLNAEYFYFLVIGILVGILGTSSFGFFGMLGWVLWGVLMGVLGVASVIIPIDRAFCTLSLDFNRGFGRPTWIVQGKYPAARDVIRIRDAGYAASDYETHKEQIAARLAQPIKSIRKPSMNIKIIEVVLKRSSIPSVLAFEALPLSNLQQGEFYIGQSDDGIEKLTLTKMIHMLVAGQTGSGKTSFLKFLLLCILGRSKNAHVALIDMKGGIDFQAFVDLPNLEMVETYDTADILLDKLVSLYEKRRDYIKSKKKSNWAELSIKDLEKDETFKGQPIGPVIVMVDEMAELSKKATAAAAGSDLQEKIAMLARLSRFTGIHLILGTQRPDKTTISMQSKENLPTRVAFSVPSVHASTLVVGDMTASTLGSHPGRAVFVHSTSKVVQTPLAPVSACEATVASIAEKLKHAGYDRSILKDVSSGPEPSAPPKLNEVSK